MPPRTVDPRWGLLIAPPIALLAAFAARQGFRDAVLDRLGACTDRDLGRFGPALDLRFDLVPFGTACVYADRVTHPSAAAVAVLVVGALIAALAALWFVASALRRRREGPRPASRELRRFGTSLLAIVGALALAVVAGVALRRSLDRCLHGGVGPGLEGFVETEFGWWPFGYTCRFHTALSEEVVVPPDWSGSALLAATALPVAAALVLRVRTAHRHRAPTTRRLDS